MRLRTIEQSPRRIRPAAPAACTLAVLALAATACGVTTRPDRNPAPAARLQAAATAELDTPTVEERRLYELLRAYRAANGLPPVPLSRSLSKVARLHARDLSIHGFRVGCAIHSWSQDGPWSPCCYRPSRPDPRCMWNKPRQLTRYEAVGYEIAYRYTAGVRASAALRSWQHSAIHNAVILNRNEWRRRSWRAVGVGIEGEYVTVWWGEEEDPAGAWR